VIVKLRDNGPGWECEHEISLPECCGKGCEWIGAEFVTFGGIEVETAPSPGLPTVEARTADELLGGMVVKAIEPSKNPPTLPGLQEQIDQLQRWTESCFVEVFKRMDKAERNLTSHEQKLGRIMDG